ncbi:MAG: phytoene/squalene synthase family protein [Myxococcales bacterium]|nr:phytoene/squalene synthase family protein [Myxococcales bacterium]
MSPQLPPAQTDFAAVIAHHSKSFSLATRLLPKTLRHDVRVLYAWCRYADDAVDEVPAAAQPAAIRRLESELDAIYAGEALCDPVLNAFAQVVRERRIPRDYPAELLAGMRMDVEGHRYDTLEDLNLYCYRVASTVGLMMCHVMGVRSTAALQRAAQLGSAMQLTNICRDVEEDWHRGRRYLPAALYCERMDGGDTYGGLLLRDNDRDPVAGDRSVGAFPAAAVEGTAGVVRVLLQRADVGYAAGQAGLIALPWRCALAVAAAGAIYQDIGRVIACQQHDVTRGRAFVSSARKLWLVGSACLTIAKQVPQRLRWARRAFTLPRGVLGSDGALIAFVGGLDEMEVSP